MKRVTVLIGMVVTAPSVAWAQVPIAPEPSAAAPATQPPPAPALAESAPGEPKVAPPASPRPPGDEYFVDEKPTAPGPAGASAEGEDPAPFEPPPPPDAFSEPPPPPLTRHAAPENSLWVGARVGWLFPSGNVWARAEPTTSSDGTSYVLHGVPWRDYASSGPMFELDVGVRLARAYTVFGLWERAQLGSGNDNSGVDGQQDGAETDFWALGLRATTNPDRLGFVTEIAIGYRRARTFFKNDVQYQFTDAPFEARLGLGAEWRLNGFGSLSSLVTVGVGGFGSAERVGPNGSALSLTRNIDDGDGHAWATLNVGGHFDLIRSRH